MMSDNLRVLNQGSVVPVIDRLIRSQNNDFLWYKVSGTEGYVPKQICSPHNITALAYNKTAKFIRVIARNPQIYIYNTTIETKNKIVETINSGEILLIIDSSDSRTNSGWHKLDNGCGYIREQDVILQTVNDFEVEPPLVNVVAASAASVASAASAASATSAASAASATSAAKTIVCNPQIAIQLLPVQAHKRKSIPKKIKELVWIAYFGEDRARSLCPLCERTEIRNTDFHCSHIVPVTSGGKDTLDNLRPLCAGCNLSMGAQNMIEYKKMYHPNSMIVLHK